MMDDFRSFEVEITDEDYKSIVYFNTFKKEKRMFFIFACVIISLFLVIVSISRGHIESYLTFSVSLGVVVLFAIQFMLTQMKIKKFLATKPSMLNIKRIVKISPEHISQSGLDSSDDVIYQYTNMRIAYELKEYFLIFTKNGKTLIIPKRFMEPNIIEYTRGVLKGNLGSDFELRKRS